MLVRLCYLGLAPFAGDQPRLLRAAWEQIETGRFADHSPVSYGPAPLWFFAVIQGLIGRHASTVIAAVVVLACACQLALILALHVRGRHPLQHSYWALAGVLIVAASSPYQFFWSRLAADLAANLGPFVALAILAQGSFGPLSGALLGLVLGLCISAHPLAAPFALACLVVVALSSIGPFVHRALSLSAAGTMLLLVNLPWLRYLRQAGPFAIPGRLDVFAPLTPEPFLQTYRPHSIWGLSFFFDADWESFSAAHPWLARPDVQQASLLSAACVTIIGLLALALQRREAGLRRVATVGVLCALGYPFLLSYWQLDDRPHHQFPVAWLTVAGAAGLFYARTRWLLPVRALALALAALNIGFIGAWGEFIWQRAGTRGDHYGTPVAEQERFMREACQTPGKLLHIDNETAMLSPAFEQIFESEAKCRAKKLDLCGENGCSDVPPADWIVRLHYRDPEGGALSWVVESARNRAALSAQ
ncbi:MAG TPA: hypothetical protein VJV78_32730 [Polyangiales bacterium]|nr:hypothetical protein [Polyangiales bacterium]